MRSVVLTLLLFGSVDTLVDQVFAQSQQFPYDAVIVDDEVYSRSGPGRQYYPTGRFRKGDRITVVRHDPGGWFMIDPPAGSFNWVRRDYIRREGDHGVVMSDSPVVAWMGTSFGDDHYVEKRRLQKGERVGILAEKLLKDERGEVAYFKIQPPAGDFRWVPGAKVMPADKSGALAQRAGRAGDPFAGNQTNADRMRDPNVAPVDLAQFGDRESEIATGTPGESQVPQPRDLAGRRQPAPTPLIDEESKTSPFARANDAEDSKLPFEKGDFPATNSRPKTANSSPAWDRIHAIDEQLQVMLRKESREWDFSSIDAELRELAEINETSGAASNRLAMLSRYQRIKTDQDELARIMEETSQRDAELTRSLAKPSSTTTTATRAVPPLTPPGRATTVPTQPLQGAKPAPSGLNSTRTSGAANPTATNATTTPSKPRFDGAGIIQRSTVSGKPKHVLIHPNGRVLAYLIAEPGINLDNFVGEQMGLEGTRAFRPELNADILKVRRLQPVKLKP